MRGYNVDIGIVPIAEKDKSGAVTRQYLEVDFIFNLGSNKVYSQSAYLIHDEEKHVQETRLFKKIDGSFKKIIVTRDTASRGMTMRYPDRQHLRFSS